MERFTILFSILLAAGCASGDQDGMRDDNQGALSNVTEVHIEAGPNGYEPSRVDVVAGRSVRLVFTRTTPSTCLEKVQIPAFGVEPVDLPMNEPVAIELIPDKTGEYRFACGMDMQHGTLLVKAE